MRAAQMRLLLIVGIIVFAAAGCSHHVGHVGVRRGMSQDDVLAAFGEPDNIKPDGNGSIWQYGVRYRKGPAVLEGGPESFSGSIFFTDGRVAAWNPD